MQKNNRGFSIALIFVFLASAAFAQDPTEHVKKQTIAPAAAGNPVVGSGTQGQITKWAGVSGSNTFVVGDSNITEDKFGFIGIGTRTPTSPLTVQGMIETTLGGIKFPDGTSQTTSAAGALFGVTHDLTLQGNGTAASPLGVAVPLALSGSLFDAVFSATNSGLGIGVSGSSTNGYAGVFGSSTNGYGVNGFSNSSVGVSGTSGSGDGVSGNSSSGDGVSGNSISGDGVSGRSTNGNGVSGQGGTTSLGNGTTGVAAAGGNGSDDGGDGVDARGGSSSSSHGGIGVVARGGRGSGIGNKGGGGILAIGGAGSDGATDGVAGSFVGDVLISGKLMVTSGIKMFHIDHPLDPENKYLNHAAIESSEVLNVYSGNTTTDPNGDAIVRLPDWFEALNKDFRYQLTVIGTFAQAIIAQKIKGNRFAIKSNAPNVEVSWQVTGVRSDSTTRKYKFEIEEEKAEREKGYYLNPDVFNQPEEKSIGWARNPEMMQRLKQQRLEAEEKIKKQQQR